MSLLRRLYLRWLFRHSTNTEMYRLIDTLQMGLRRCAYDLGHCLSLAKPEDGDWRCNLRGRLEAKHHHWVKLASPKGIKQYSTEINSIIDRLENELEKRRKVMEENNLHLDDDIPFEVEL